MATFVRENAFSTLLGVASIVASLAGAWFFWRRGQPKRLGWSLETDTRMVAEAARTVGRALTVSWNLDGEEQALADPRLIRLRVLNTGTSEITSLNWEGQPIRVVVPGAEVVSVTIIERAAPMLHVELAELIPGTNEVSLKPGLLNPGEWFALQMVVDGGSDRPTLEAQVPMRSLTGDVQRPLALSVICFMLVWIGVGAMLAISVLALTLDRNLNSVLAFVLLLTLLSSLLGLREANLVKRNRGVLGEHWFL